MSMPSARQRNRLGIFRMRGPAEYATKMTRAAGGAGTTMKVSFLCDRAAIDIRVPDAAIVYVSHFPQCVKGFGRHENAG